MQDRTCSWCRGPIPQKARRDAVCCSVRCRQAKHRFVRTVGVATEAADRPLRLAYADPPYPGLSAKYYRSHQDYEGEVDHADLIRHLCTYDGWALSTSAAALPEVLALCPPGVRVAAWHRGARVNVRARRPLNAWEPVIYHGGRVVRHRGDASLERDATRRAHQVRRVAQDLPDASLPTDSLIRIARPRTTDPNRVIGAKPPEFCRWVFDLLGALPGDQLQDLFPGSGAVARAWETYTVRAAR